MALTGVHLVWGGVSTPNSTTATLPNGAAFQSQTMTSAGTSNGAPGGYPLLSISASAPIFYAVGATPDASQATGSGQAARRYYDPATGREDIFVGAGDKVAWQFA